MNAVFLFDELIRGYVLYGHAQNLRHRSPQNRFNLKEFNSTTREIGLIIFQSKQANLVNLQFLSDCALFSKNWCRNLFKKEPRI